MIAGFLDGNIVMIVGWNYILLVCVAGRFQFVERANERRRSISNPL